MKEMQERRAELELELRTLESNAKTLKYVYDSYHAPLRSLFFCSIVVVVCLVPSSPPAHPPSRVFAAFRFGLPSFLCLVLGLVLVLGLFIMIVPFFGLFASRVELAMPALTPSLWTPRSISPPSLIPAPGPSIW